MMKPQVSWRSILWRELSQAATSAAVATGRVHAQRDGEKFLLMAVDEWCRQAGQFSRRGTGGESAEREIEPAVWIQAHADERSPHGRREARLTFSSVPEGLQKRVGTSFDLYGRGGTMTRHYARFRRERRKPYQRVVHVRRAGEGEVRPPDGPGEQAIAHERHTMTHKRRVSR